MPALQKPYWSTDDLAGTDFNRQLAEPGKEPLFPKGVVGIYVDDNFWCVAALPWRYRDVALPDIVAEFWPTYAAEATYTPDSDTDERRVFEANAEAAAMRKQNKYLNRALGEANAELARLRAGRTTMQVRNPTRLEDQNRHFIAQYETLLVAMAHRAEPKPDLPGICRLCGLLVSNRVHEAEWIERNAAGYPPDHPFHHGDER